MKIDDYITIRKYDPPTRMDIVWDNERFKVDYETRLKDDMVAVLTDLQLEIEESENCGKAFHLGLQMASNIIQEKINSLKEDKNEIQC